MRNFVITLSLCLTSAWALAQPEATAPGDAAAPDAGASSPPASRPPAPTPSPKEPEPSEQLKAAQSETPAPPAPGGAKPSESKPAPASASRGAEAAQGQPKPSPAPTAEGAQRQPGATPPPAPKAPPPTAAAPPPAPKPPPTAAAPPPAPKPPPPTAAAVPPPPARSEDPAWAAARQFFADLLAADARAVVSRSAVPFQLEDKRIQSSDALLQEWLRHLRAKRTDLVKLYSLEVLEPAEMEKRYGRPPARLSALPWRHTGAVIAIANLSGKAAVAVLRKSGAGWQVVGYTD